MHIATLFPDTANATPPDTKRGLKRSRSPDVSSQLVGEDGDFQGDYTIGRLWDRPILTCLGTDDSKPRKRGRPTKKSGDLTDTARAFSGTPKGGTPQPKVETVPQASPPKNTSPPKDTPSKTQKALPTQRDHTTDQLNPEGDEYIVRDTDEAGEQKVTPTGHLRDGREYRCRTFYVPNRGDKLFMLATECARVLVYRDSYLLFNKNRSLHKIIANQVEKDHLISEGILPYSYRSRQIAMVTARSMFRQFGARIIQNGRRVRDDYWEHKARKQGFTEDDLASDKRPATSKPKEPPGEVPSANTTAMNVLAGSQIQYVDNPLQDPSLLPGAGLGIGNIVPNNMFSLLGNDDLQRDYGTLRRPRQDITGTPYQDRTQNSSQAEIVNQAAQAAEYNKQMRAQSQVRGQLISNEWNREHHSETPELLQTLPPDDPAINPPTAPQHTSPQQNMRNFPSAAQNAARSQSLMQQQQQQHRRSSSTLNNQSYATQHPYQAMQSPAQIHQPVPGSGQMASAQLPSAQMPGAPQARQPSYPYTAQSAAAAMQANSGMLHYLQQQQQQAQQAQQSQNMYNSMHGTPHQGMSGTPHPGSSGTPNPQHPHQSPMHGGHAQLPGQYGSQMSPHMARSPQTGMQGAAGLQGLQGMQSGAGGGGGMQAMAGGMGMQGSSQLPSSMSMTGGMGFQNIGAGAMPGNPYAAMGRGMFQGQGSPQQFMGAGGGGQAGGGGGAGMSMYSGINHMQGVGGQNAGQQWGGF